MKMRRRKTLRLTTLLSVCTGLTMFQSGSCMQDFTRTLASGLSSSIISATISIVDQILLQPVLDTLVPNEVV